ncbi:hypothetical protein D3273_16010 [Lichenibacterium minor]|uniref:DNA adenine methylase n=1 Tax=Lichenibacterium minor TaxID=2316528 RepID=A0A4Q2U7Z2_9HYPH|nr:DNA adenine methylase [Lichenibacterium minor]RYC31036.1 hypothetical protein D3273_16010 [Lichenibacterium minor]
MGAHISYMGTKRGLAPMVVEVLSQAKPGIVFDVFAGMCSVAEAVAPWRNVWTNDVQHFAYLVGHCLFKAKADPLSCTDAADEYHLAFLSHRDDLIRCFADTLKIERSFNPEMSFSEFSTIYADYKETLKREINNIDTLSIEKFFFFTKFYSDSYFGLQQAIDIDALSCSVRGQNRNSSRTAECLRWAIVAMGRAAIRIANSTGHFAQFLKPKENNFKVFIRQRRRLFWEEWLAAIDELRPVGTIDWRLENRC